MTDTPEPPKSTKTGGPYGGYDTPQQWFAAEPDLFDAMDCRPGPSRLSEEYSDSLIPEHVRERVMAKRRARRTAKSASR
jgi:hypothetical protein